MRRRDLIVVLVGCGLLLAGAVARAASPQKPKAKSPLAKAQDAVRAAQDRAAAAAVKVKTAQARLNQLTRDAKLKWQEVEKTHDAAPALVAARNACEQSKGQYQDVSRPLLNKVHSESEYRTALADREALQAKLKALPRETSDDRKEVEHQLALAYTRVRKIEKEAIQSNPEARSLLEALERDEAVLQEQVKVKEAAMERDATLAGVRQSIAHAKIELGVAQQAAAAESRNLAAARRHLAEEEAKHKKPPKKKRR